MHGIVKRYFLNSMHFFEYIKSPLSLAFKGFQGFKPLNCMRCYELYFYCIYILFFGFFVFFYRSYGMKYTIFYIIQPFSACMHNRKPSASAYEMHLCIRSFLRPHLLCPIRKRQILVQNTLYNEGNRFSFHSSRTNFIVFLCCMPSRHQRFIPSPHLFCSFAIDIYCFSINFC